jgi:hypothetical protein
MANKKITVPRHEYVPKRSYKYMKSLGYCDRDIRRILAPTPTPTPTPKNS